MTEKSRGAGRRTLSGAGRGHAIDRAATGRNIRTILREEGLSAAAVAEALDIATQSVYRWMSGKALPSLDTLFLLAQLLEKEIDEILVGADRENPVRAA